MPSSRSLLRFRCDTLWTHMASSGSVSGDDTLSLTLSQPTPSVSCDVILAGNTPYGGRRFGRLF